MTFTEFLANNFAEVIGLIFIWIIITKENVLDQKEVRKLKSFVYCELAELIAFNLEKLTGEWDEPSVLRILLSAIAYVLRIVLVYLFVRYIWPHEDNKRARILLVTPIYICTVCAFSPFFTDIVYTFNAENVFVRGPLGSIFVVAVIGYVCAFVYYVCKRGASEDDKVDRTILLLIAFFIVTSTILSTVYDIEWLGRLSIVYGMVFCLSTLDFNKLKNTINVLRENEELKAALEELKVTKQAAESANRAKTEFLLRMSHDIRTPINGIMGMLEIAEKSDDDLDKRDECREKIKESSKILLELVNEVLDMSKLESGEIVLEHTPFSLIEVCKEVYYSVEKLAEERDIEIIYDDFEEMDARLIGSPTHLKRVMMNIIGNAIKYNKNHGKIYLICKEVDNNGEIVYLEFKCTDTGIGMSPEFLEHVFEPFTQEETSSRTRYAGTGLGMSIAKNLVDKMGGTITVESVKDEGSTFDVILPFEIDRSVAKETLSEKDTEDYSVKGLHILLVEDNELNMEIAKFLLEEAGADITQAWNGEEAVNAFSASAPGTYDAVLMDIMMPVIDGYEATRRIRAMDHADAQTIPIIAMTANAFAEDKLASKEAGMNDHISKPLDINLVVKTVATLAAGSR